MRALDSARFSFEGDSRDVNPFLMTYRSWAQMFPRSEAGPMSYTIDRVKNDQQTITLLNEGRMAGTLAGSRKEQSISRFPSWTLYTCVQTLEFHGETCHSLPLFDAACVPLWRQ